MQHAAFFRKMTSHGSINVPVGLRRQLGIENRDPMMVEEKDGTILIRPCRPRCVFCGSFEIRYSIRGKGLCRECVDSMKETGGKADDNSNRQKAGRDDQ